MAVRTVEELLKAVADRVGEDNSDEAISFIEDVNDTVRDLEARTADTTGWEEKYNNLNTEWETKYNDLDNEWRTRYRERFFQPTDTDDLDIVDDVNDVGEDGDGEEVKTFEDLFVIEEEK